MSHYYDVIVLGSEMAGALAGALLARRGFRVLVARVPEEEDDAYPEAGHTLFRSVQPLLGIDGPAWRRILVELNLQQSLRRRLVPQRPPFQVILPDARLDGEAERATSEIDRELPDGREPLEAFFARAETLGKILDPLLAQDVTLPPDGFWERRELGRIRPHLPPHESDLLPGASASARAYAFAPAALAGDLVPPGPVAYLRQHDQWRHGVFRLPGGRDALRKLIHDRIQTHSGEVTSLVIRELALKRGKIIGVVTHPRGETLGCGFVIAAMTTEKLCALLGDEAPKRLKEAAQEIRPAAWRYVQNIVLSAEGLPEGMSENVFVLGDPAAPLDGPNAIALHPLDVEEAGRAGLQVVALARTQDPRALPALGEAVRARLREQLMPFLDRHLVNVHSPHEGDAPRPMEPVYEADEPGPLGVGATAIATGIKGLLMVGRQTLPGLAQEGELAAAWGAARLISQSEKKRDPLKREILISS
jgi:phytoene dehydrogenase-like protein